METLFLQGLRFLFENLLEKFFLQGFWDCHGVSCFLDKDKFWELLFDFTDHSTARS